MPFGAMLGSFGVQVGGCGGLSWRFGSLFGVYVGSCRAQMEVWEVLLVSFVSGRAQTGDCEADNWSGRAWVGPGAAGDPQIGPTWALLEPSWSQFGPNMDPT